MSGRRRRSWRLTPALPDALASLAAAVNDRHAALLGAGYCLADGRSGVWRRQDGRLSVRLVYRRGEASIVFSARVEVLP